MEHTRLAQGLFLRYLLIDLSLVELLLVLLISIVGKLCALFITASPFFTVSVYYKQDATCLAVDRIVI